jgi:hypothetical protein
MSDYEDYKRDDAEDRWTDTVILDPPAVCQVCLFDLKLADMVMELNAGSAHLSPCNLIRRGKAAKAHWISEGMYLYGDDADGNRGIKRMTWTCSGCGEETE